MGIRIRLGYIPREIGPFGPCPCTEPVKIVARGGYHLREREMGKRGEREREREREREVEEREMREGERDREMRARDGRGRER